MSAVATGRRPGRATADWRAAYAAPFAPDPTPGARGPLVATGLTVSAWASAGYRVDDATPEHRAALERALQAGVGLSDVSANYADGGSEPR
jgi:hypothetical protein